MIAFSIRLSSTLWKFHGYMAELEETHMADNFLEGLIRFIAVHLVWGAIRIILWVVLLLAGLVIAGLVGAYVATFLDPTSLDQALKIGLAILAGLLVVAIYYYSLFYALVHDWLVWMYVSLGDDDD